MNKGYPAVFKMSPQISDVITGEVLSKPPKEAFVELLTHNSYTIQIPSLTNTLQTRIEKVLMIFSPKYGTDDRHKSDYVGSTDDDLVNKILHRLVRAVSDEQMRKNMDVEDEIENTIANLLHEKDEKIAARDKKIAEKEKKIAEDARKMDEDARKMDEDRPASRGSGCGSRLVRGRAQQPLLGPYPPGGNRGAEEEAPHAARQGREDRLLGPYRE